MKYFYEIFCNAYKCQASICAVQVSTVPGWQVAHSSFC